MQKTIQCLFHINLFKRKIKEDASGGNTPPHVIQTKGKISSALQRIDR